MKGIYLMLFYLSFISCLNAQDATCTFPCGSLQENKPILFDNIAIQSHNPYGKQASNYTDPEYKNDYVGEPGEDNSLCNLADFPNPDDPDDAVICNTDDPNYVLDNVLYYDVYYATDLTKQQYIDCPLPCIIYFHGGGFSDCVDMGSDVSFLRKLAKRHFVVFNVEYRRGKIFDDDNTLYSVQQVLAFYRAFQDARGAIRSIIKRQNNENTFNDPYRIDINNIFLAGASAGSVIALNAAYYTDDAMINQIFPNISAALGNINANFYYGSPTIEYASKIKGVLNQWGNAFVPFLNKSDPAAFFASYSTPKPPMISFHGAQDPVATFNLKDIKFSASNHLIYNTETSCVLSSYSLDLS